jgi:hypothetical protein
VTAENYLLHHDGIPTELQSTGFHNCVAYDIWTHIHYCTGKAMLLMHMCQRGAVCRCLCFSAWADIKMFVNCARTLALNVVHY